MILWSQFQELFSFLFNLYTFLGDKVFLFYLNNSRDILNFMHISFKFSFDVLLYVAIALTAVHLFIAIVTAFKKPDAEQSIKNYPFVTIQIPTYNELAAINCAKKALDFDYPKDKYEIIIGDDSNDVEISKQFDAFAKKHSQVKITRRGSNIGYKPGNLNHMLKHTKGDYIVIFDSDFLPGKDFLKRIIAPFTNDENIAAVQARWSINNFSYNFSSIIGGMIPMFSHKLGLPFLNMIGSNGFIAGSAEAVKKKTLLELGGWTSGALTEDIEYSLRMTKNGHKIVYLEGLECDCESPFTVKDLCRQQMRWAYGVIKALKTHMFDILFSRHVKSSWKVNPLLLLSGYTITFIFFLLAILGTLSIISAEPAPIDWAKFFGETGINILLTSGFLVTNLIILGISKKMKESFKLVLASFSIGLLVIYTVSIGIFKATFNRDMEWFMLNKKGNEL